MYFFLRERGNCCREASVSCIFARLSSKKEIAKHLRMLGRHRRDFARDRSECELRFDVRHGKATFLSRRIFRRSFQLFGRKTRHPKQLPPGIVLAPNARRVFPKDEGKGNEREGKGEGGRRERVVPPPVTRVTRVTPFPLSQNIFNGEGGGEGRGERKLFIFPRHKRCRCCAPDGNRISIRL